jgi:hypothetical protein
MNQATEEHQKQTTPINEATNYVVIFAPFYGGLFWDFIFTKIVSFCMTQWFCQSMIC